MLKLRKRHAPTTKIDGRVESLKIRDLLDDPQLRAVMGDVVLGGIVTPIQLDWSGSEPVQPHRFGRRLLQRAA